MPNTPISNFQIGKSYVRPPLISHSLLHFSKQEKVGLADTQAGRHSAQCSTKTF
eukprot:c25810_g1_i1 orf=2-160(-)